MDAPAIQSIALIGGGRWSRVLVSVLTQVAPNAHITWVTDHGFDSAQQWCQQHESASVTIVRTLDSLKLPDAAIVANDPCQHFHTALRFVQMSVPTLCEKPAVLELEDASELMRQAAARNVPLGVNLVLHHASYVQEFAAQIRDMAIRSLELVWHDPWVERRHGESKHAAYHTDMTHDMLPHAWSLLRVCHQADELKVREVRYSPESTKVYASLGDIDANVSLSRRAGSRKRQIIVNEGEAVLDFSHEPGVTTIGTHRIDNVWTGRRPLAESLSRFLEVACNPELIEGWDLSLHHCLDSVRYAADATALLDRAQRESLAAIQQSGFDIDNHEHLALAVDMLGPERAREGKRPSLIGAADQRSAVLEWLNSQRSDRRTE